MKVLMIPCGIGVGHISRDMTIARRLEEKGVEVVFASYGSGYEILAESGEYETIKLPDIKFYGNGDGLDIKYTAKKSVNAPFIFLKSIYHESKIIKNFKPDIVVADSHYSVPITCKVLRIPCVLITNELTLNFSKHYPDDKTVEYLENGLRMFIEDVSNLCNAIIIPDIQDSIEVPSKLEDKIIYTGPILKNSPEKLPSKEKLREKFGFSMDQKIVLVTVGGSDFGKKLLKLIHKAMAGIDCDKIIIVTGPQIEPDFIPNSDKIVKKKFLKDMMEWMKLSDVIISLAGHNTTMEIASLGIPSILVPIENHPEQLQNALNMEKLGISMVKNIKKLDSEEIANNINNMLYNNGFKMKSNLIGKQFSKYGGTEAAVEIILEYAKSKEQTL